MLIEIRGGGFKNKGAELMVLSVLENLVGDFCIEPSKSSGSQPYSSYAKLSVYPSSRIYRRGFDFGFFWKFVPNVIKELYGIKNQKSIDLVLDVSGYSYSDDWGKSRLLELKNRIKECLKYNTKFIFMPQAFGPLSSENAKIMKWCINNSFKTFCRDKESYNYLLDIGVEKNDLCISPDFTTCLNYTEEPIYNSNNRLLIIPNYRMIDKGLSTNYVNKLVSIIKYAKQKNVETDILVHEGKDDLCLAQQIIDLLNYKLDILKPEDGIIAKNTIKKYKLVISGRYHASVSSLSSGVPCLSTSWSHKYKYLHEDFSFDEGLISDIDNFIVTNIDKYLNDDYQLVIRKSLNESRFKIYQKNIELFKSISEL